MTRAAEVLPAHLAHWLLVREQFEPVPDNPGLYRLTSPERDGIRRTRQAVHDLRRLGYTVQADPALDPALTAPPPQPTVRNELMERRRRIAQAAATPSPQRASAPSATPGRPLPQHTAVPTTGRNQSHGYGHSR